MVHHGTQHNDAQFNNKNATLSITIPSITINSWTLSIMILSIAIKNATLSIRTINADVMLT
jgi:hypothetical protein